LRAFGYQGFESRKKTLFAARHLGAMFVGVGAESLVLIKSLSQSRRVRRNKVSGVHSGQYKHFKGEWKESYGGFSEVARKIEDPAGISDFKKKTFLLKKRGCNSVKF
jgi:hypothetical protein